MFEFKAYNNEATYKAIIYAPRGAYNLVATRKKLFTNSQLVVNQCGGNFEAKYEHT